MKEDEIPDQIDPKDAWMLYHHMFGEGGSGSRIHTILGRKGVLPAKNWRKGKFSIIEPCEVTFGMYELFDGVNILRFDSLREAKNCADNIRPYDPE